MDPHENDLLIEVYVSAGTRSEHFTGYPIALDRILTARHGLLLGEQGAERTIEVRWPAPAAKARDWCKATVAWERADLDVAVLACSFPDAVRLRFPLPWDRPLDGKRRWSGAGFAAAGDTPRAQDDPGPPRTGRYPFGGSVYPGATGEARFQVGVDHPCDDSRWYAGASGMPVLVDHRIAGVVIEPDLTAKTHLAAISIGALLADPVFRQVIGHDQRLARRTTVERTIAGYLGEPRLKGLRERLQIDLSGLGAQCPSAAPATVAQALLAAELPLVWKAIGAALAHAGAASSAWRHGIADIVGVLLPVGYDPGAAAHPDGLPVTAWCIELPACCTTAGEVIMAGLRSRPARFRPLEPGSHALPQPRDLLPGPPEAGFDGDRTAFANDVETDLANLLGAGNTAAVEAWLGRAFKPAAEAKVHDDTGRAAVRRLVARELEARAPHEQRFYYVLLNPSVDPARDQAQPAVLTLKETYQALDFAVLSYPDDLDVLDREETQLLMLRYLLPSTQDPSP